MGVHVPKDERLRILRAHGVRIYTDYIQCDSNNSKSPVAEFHDTSSLLYKIINREKNILTCVHEVIHTLIDNTNIPVVLVCESDANAPHRNIVRQIRKSKSRSNATPYTDDELKQITSSNDIFDKTRLQNTPGWKTQIYKRIEEYINKHTLEPSWGHVVCIGQSEIYTGTANEELLTACSESTAIVEAELRITYVIKKLFVRERVVVNINDTDFITIILVNGLCNTILHMNTVNIVTRYEFDAIKDVPYITNVWMCALFIYGYDYSVVWGDAVNPLPGDTSIETKGMWLGVPAAALIGQHAYTTNYKLLKEFATTWNPLMIDKTYIVRLLRAISTSRKTKESKHRAYNKSQTWDNFVRIVAQFAEYPSYLKVHMRKTDDGHVVHTTNIPPYAYFISQLADIITGNVHDFTNLPGYMFNNSSATFNRFSAMDIQLIDEGHIYKMQGQERKSVVDGEERKSLSFSSIRFAEPFNAGNILTRYKSDEAQKLLLSWKKSNENARESGSQCHALAEDYILGKNRENDWSNIYIQETTDTVDCSENKRQFLSALERITRNMNILRTEQSFMQSMKCGDDIMNVHGTADLLLSPKPGDYQPETHDANRRGAVIIENGLLGNNYHCSIGDWKFSQINPFMSQQGEDALLDKLKDVHDDDIQKNVIKELNKLVNKMVKKLKKYSIQGLVYRWMAKLPIGPKAIAIFMHPKQQHEEIVLIEYDNTAFNAFVDLLHSANWRELLQHAEHQNALKEAETKFLKDGDFNHFIDDLSISSSIQDTINRLHDGVTIHCELLDEKRRCEALQKYETYLVQKIKDSRKK